jgi:PTH1 family peptidyl-tRNA hydrolase
MKFVVGLGNPGGEYVETRHNVGFRVIDELAKALHVKLNQKKCEAKLAETQFNGEKVILAKPLTYMNNSGRVVSPLVAEYGGEVKDLIVIFDDVSLGTGKIRIRRGGTSGGHKGVESVIEELHSDEFPRIKLGVGPPPDDVDLAQFVLSNFEDSERELIDKAIKRAAEAAIVVIREGIASAMNKYNSSNP